MLSSSHLVEMCFKWAICCFWLVAGRRDFGITTILLSHYCIAFLIAILRVCWSVCWFYCGQTVKGKSFFIYVGK